MIEILILFYQIRMRAYPQFAYVMPFTPEYDSTAVNTPAYQGNQYCFSEKRSSKCGLRSVVVRRAVCKKIISLFEQKIT